MNIGVMGGTFDPVHDGHLAVAEEARLLLHMSEVIFVPAGQPWMKADRNISPAPDRVEMLRLALAGKTYFRLATMEIERTGPSFTIDTITRLRLQLKEDDRLFFILGWDSLAQIPKWRDGARLTQMCYLAAAPRPGLKPPDLKVLESSLPGISERVILMDRPNVDISASDIRERVSSGLPIDHLVPALVARYIKEHGLYLPKQRGA